LTSREDLGGGYWVLRFAADPPLKAKPGHFAMVRSLRWGQAPLLARPMSLLTVGTEPSLLVKVVGEGTRRMAAAPEGERFSLLAPLGQPWTLPPDEHRAILVAGGVGLAPLLFLARELRARGRGRGRRGRRAEGPPAVLALYGGRTARDLPLAAELAQVAELRLATEDGSEGAHGRVTTLLDDALDGCSPAAEPATVYTCGPHRMMAAVARAAVARGIPCQASLEAMMACGYGVCLGCAVPRASGGYLYACSDGPCVDARLIGWTEEATP